MGTQSCFQISALAAGLPNFAAPNFKLDPYLAPEIYEGDTTDIQSGVLGSTYPYPTLGAVSAALNGVAKGTSYTTQVGDAGKTLQVSQTADGGVSGQTTHASAAVVVQAFKSFANLNYLGGNVSAPAEYGQMALFANAAFEGRGFAAQSTSYPIVQGSATLTLGATSGSGVALTLGSNVGCLSANSSDVGRLFYLGSNGAYATVTGFTDVTHCTVTITGTASSTSFTTSNWYMTIPTDSDGNPLIASTLLLVAYTGAGGGHLPNGTYYGTYQSPSGASALTSSGTGWTVGSIVTVGTTTTFTITITDNSALNGFLIFSGPISGLVIPRDGSQNFTTLPLFNPVCVAYHSQFACLRGMDFLNTNGRADVNWSDATRLNRLWPMHVVNLPGAGQQQLSWELWIDFVNACYSYTGSKVKAMHICVPYGATISYATSLSNLLASHAPSGAVATNAVQTITEDSNEPWNPSFVTLNAYQKAGELEAQSFGLTGYGQLALISSVVQSGTTVTVNLSVTVASLVALMGLNIQVGSTFAVCNISDVSWNIIPSTASPSNLATVATVSTSSFTYNNAPTGHTGGVTTLPAGQQYGVFFNTTSNLLASNLSFNIYSLSDFYHCRKTYLMKQAWSRSQDRFVLGIQWGRASTAANGANNLVPSIFAYASYIGGGSAAWLWGIAGAPYINPQMRVTTNGTNQFQIPVAGRLATGDTITVNGTTTTCSDVTGTTVTTVATPGAGPNVTCCITAPTAAGSGARLIATMVDNVAIGSNYDAQMRAFVYEAVILGCKAYFYEGGPDLSVTAPNMQLTAQTDPAMNGLVQAIADMCFKNGGNIFNFYSVTPSSFSNGTNGGWNICQNYGDTTSPKLVGYLSYGTAYGFANQSGAPGTALMSQGQAFSSGSLGSGAGAANFRWFNYAIDNFHDELIVVPRTRRFKLILTGTDSARADPTVLSQVSLYIDPSYTGNGTLVGTTSVTANGAAATSAGVDCAAMTTVLTSGPHIVRVFLPANAGVATGFSQLKLVAY